MVMVIGPTKKSLPIFVDVDFFHMHQSQQHSVLITSIFLNIPFPCSALLMYSNWCTFVVAGTTYTELQLRALRLIINITHIVFIIEFSLYICLCSFYCFVHFSNGHIIILWFTLYIVCAHCSSLVGILMPTLRKFLDP